MFIKSCFWVAGREQGAAVIWIRVPLAPTWAIGDDRKGIRPNCWRAPEMSRFARGRGHVQNKAKQNMGAGDASMPVK